MLRDLLRLAIAVGRRRETLKATTLAQYRAKTDRKLDRLLGLLVVTPAGAELRRQTLRWRHQFFVFLTDPEVPATNNASERALRSSVIFRKLTNGFRSLWGASAHALIRSVIDTGCLNGFTSYQAVSQALAGQTFCADHPAT